MPDLIQYTISPSSPEAHIFSVTLIVKRPDEAGQVLSLPAWIPGILVSALVVVLFNLFAMLSLKYLSRTIKN